MLDITWGNMTQEEADRIGEASVRPVDAAIAGVACSGHQPGDTEPWISRLVGDFVVATGARTVLETGCFTGATSVYIFDALLRLGGASTFVMCDIDTKRGDAAFGRVRGSAPPRGETPVEIQVALASDVISFLLQTELRFDLAWVDDDHTKVHVTRELMLLMPKMNPGGLILLHDVYGTCDLQDVVRKFGGYSLKLPRLGPAGGLGVIQT